MSDTPETDAVVRNAKIADHPPTRLAAILTVKCEKLERERDEAREENAKLRDIAKRAIEAIPFTEGYGEFSYAAAVLRAELNQLKEGAK
jgi:hypothetical protein